jgi:Fe-S cluster assembly ATP-binding protein
MIKIQNLKAGIEDTLILNGINLEVKAGEVHAIMGPNGSGKSTLASVIAGKEDYEVTEGEIDFEGDNLLELPPEERANKGVFLSFQYPVEIPGISVSNFIKTSINERRKANELEPMPTPKLLKMMREKMELLSIKEGYLSRNMNQGFSGGEKKRNEIFQMAMLEVNKLKTKDNATIVITHYQRLLDYIVPDFVHVLHDGRIIKSGGATLAHQLEEKGYDWITKEADKKWA